MSPLDLISNVLNQSFINGIVAFKVLDRPQFAALQSKLFPIYFGMQTAIPAVLALTYPGSRSALGGGSAGIAGVLDAPNRWSVLAPLATMFVTGLANMAFVGPATTKTMRDRKSQGEQPSGRFGGHSSYLSDIFSAHREEGWQEELRPRSSLGGDAEAEQEVWQAPRLLVASKPCHVHCDRRLRCHVVGTDQRPRSAVGSLSAGSGQAYMGVSWCH